MKKESGFKLMYPLRYACNSLTNFEYEVYAMTGNGNYLNLLKLA